MSTVSVTVSGTGGTITLHELPDKCPFCHVAIIPKALYGFFINSLYSVFMNCPNADCRQCFIAYYDHVSEPVGHQNMFNTSKVKIVYTKRNSIGNVDTRDFPDEIKNISSDFVKIYNEAYAAEQRSLLEICGMGYRKALEFLIKKYLITIEPSKQIEIETKMLGSCINDHVQDQRIKEVAKRAVWLGNDETHFIRKWDKMNLPDLKQLIDLTIHWIEAEILTASFLSKMP